MTNYSDNIGELYTKCDDLRNDQTKLDGRMDTLEKTTELELKTINTTMQTGFDEIKSTKKDSKDWIMGIVAVLAATVIIAIGTKMLDKVLTPKDTQIKTIIEEINKQNAKTS